MIDTRAFFIAALMITPIASADVVVPVDTVARHVNVRENPEASADVVSRLKRGDSLPHLGTEDGWRKVRLEDGTVGYISADWTNLVAGDTSSDVTPANAVAEASDPPKASDDGAADAASDPAEKTAAVAAAVEDVERTAVDTAGAAEDAVAAVEESVADAAGAAEAAEPLEDAVAPDVAAKADTAEDVVADADAVVGDSTGATPVQQSAGDVRGPAGPPGPRGEPGPPGGAAVEGTENYVVKFIKSTIGGNSQIFDDGRNIGIGTTEPKQRLEVNGSIQIHEQNSSVAGLMITQSSGETGYIMHNRANTLTIGAGSVDRMTIDRAGNVGIGQARPSHPLELASGAHVTAGGVWTNSSSIENKENVESLTPEEALAALAALEPVLFNYKTDRADRHAGFIAEDVPDLVASRDRKGLSPMDIVAVLTRVVQLQQERIEDLETRLAE